MTNAWLPPGQVPTQKFPVVGERVAPPIDLAAWRLQIDGLVASPRSWTLDEIRALPHRDRTTPIHCVTGWSRQTITFSGFPLADVLDLVEPLPDARFAYFLAEDSTRRHDTSLPLDLARTDTWLVDACDGAPLTPEHGAPLRTVTPSRYFYKSLKWVTRITLQAEDTLGFWERTSDYHNDADPWTEQRYTGGSMTPPQVAALRRARSLDVYRQRRKVILGADLRGWSPADRDLHDLALKNCDLRDADLSRTNLRHANLTRSDLRGANLAHADLEGADLRGADLSHANLSHTALSATRFAHPHTRLLALRWDHTHGLLESEHSFLEGSS